MTGDIFQTAAAMSPTKSALSRAVPTRETLLANIAKTDPAKAQELRKQQAKMDDTLAQLNATRKNADSRKKEAARQKIDQIKAQMQALRYLAAANPKAAARQAKQLARDLARAVKDYTAAGGSTGSDTASTNATSAENQASTANATEAAAAASGSTVAATTVQPVTTAEQAAKPWQDAQNALKEDAGARTEAEAFARDIRRMISDLKNIIQKARQKLKLDTKSPQAHRDLDDAHKSLAETEATLRSGGNSPFAGLSGVSTATTSSGLNLLV